MKEWEAKERELRGGGGGGWGEGVLDKAVGKAKEK